VSDEKHSHALAAEEVLRLKVKAELRKRMRGVRKTTPIEAIEARSKQIAERLEPLLSGAKRVASFWPIVARHEVDLRAVDSALRARAVVLAYPTIDPESGVMTMRETASVDVLEERGYGFSEPPHDAPEAKNLDVVIVPALAIDPSGHRIGYGAGYYDRTLPRYCPPAISVAVAFDWQLVSEVPFTEHDVRVHWIVTDARTIEARST
jgi:5-formyltetrahydrofolate cyclo-ligase